MTIKNATVVKTLGEVDYSNGNKFVCVYSKANILLDEVFRVAICTGENGVKITGVSLGGTSNLLMWNMFYGSNVNRETGDQINQIRLNSAIESTSNALMIMNPDINDKGIKVFEPGDIHAVGAKSADERMFKQNEDLITAGEGVFLAKNTDSYIEIQNLHDSGKCNIVVKIHFTKVPDGYKEGSCFVR